MPSGRCIRRVQRLERSEWWVADWWVLLGGKGERGYYGRESWAGGIRGGL